VTMDGAMDSPNPNEIADIVDKVGSGLDKGSSAIDRIFPEIATRSHGRAEDKNTKRIIKAIKRIDADPDLDDSMKQLLKIDAVSRYNRYARVEDIVGIAESIGATNQPVDKEWSEYFYDYASKVSDEEAKVLWANILKGEKDKPGSFSKRTLACLSAMSKQEANAFRRLCSLSFGISLDNKYINIPLVDDLANESFPKIGFAQSELNLLDSIGLVRAQNQSFRTGSTIVVGKESYVKANNRYLKISSGEFHLDLSEFTQIGQELSSICEIGTALGFVEYLVGRLHRDGFSVVLG